MTTNLRIFLISWILGSGEESRKGIVFPKLIFYVWFLLMAFCWQGISFKERDLGTLKVCTFLLLGANHSKSLLWVSQWEIYLVLKNFSKLGNLISSPSWSRKCWPSSIVVTQGPSKTYTYLRDYGWNNQSLFTRRFFFLEIKNSFIMKILITNVLSFRCILFYPNPSIPMDLIPNIQNT